MKAEHHDLCANIHLPDAALKQHIAILGKTGSGKTFTAKGIVEKLLAQSRRVCIIDPTGAWHGLRSSFDGEKPGFEVVILGGTHGDAPLPALSGMACAELVVSGNVQVVFDTSAMTVGERTRWFIDFGTALYRLNTHPLHLIIDEAHVFAPQGKVPDPETGKMLHAANSLASGGRSRGIRLMMLTQRPAKLHKDSLTCCDTLIAMRVIAPQDREAIEDWVLGCGDKVKGKQVLDSLAQLSKGEGWVWFPEGGVLERVKFPKITTFDSSKTPDDGGEVAPPKRRAEIDLASIQATMSEAVKQQEANDPKKLRARIAELEREVKTAAATIDPMSVVIEGKPIRWWIDECERIRDEAASDYAALSYWRQTAREAHSVLDLAFKLEEEKKSASRDPLTVERKCIVCRRAATHVHQMNPYCDACGVSPVREQPNHTHLIGTDARTKVHGSSGTTPSAAARKVERPAASSGLTGPQQRVLNALAEWRAIGVNNPTRFQVGFLAGYTASSGTFRNILSELRSAGLIDYPGTEAVYLTPDGSALADGSEAPTSLDDLHGRIRQKLNGPQAKLFDFLITKNFGKETGRTMLADNTGYTESSGTFRNLLSEMNGLGLFRYPTKRTVAATDILFPEGLR